MCADFEGFRGTAARQVITGETAQLGAVELVAVGSAPEACPIEMPNRGSKEISAKNFMWPK